MPRSSPSFRRRAGRALAPLLAAVALAAAPSARADSIVLAADLAARTEGLGSFSGLLSYHAIDGGNASLAIDLTNTIDPSVGGYLTAFVFNNPGGAITGLTMTAAPAHFAATLGDGNLGLEPFGRFDVQVGIGNGRPQRGLAAGASGRFEFALIGSGLDSLTAASFLQELSVPPGAGGGLRSFVVRFQAIPTGAGSDKVPALYPPDGAEVVPEPASVLSLAMGLGGLGLFARALRRRRRAG